MGGGTCQAWWGNVNAFAMFGRTLSLRGEHDPTLGSATGQVAVQHFAQVFQADPVGPVIVISRTVKAR